MNLLVKIAICALVVVVSSVEVDGASPSRHAHPNLGIPHQPRTVEGMSSFMFVFIAIAVMFCGIVLVFGCADICQRHSGFKDFDNEDSYNQEVTTSPPTQSEFTMYPPVENTPDSMSATPIVFEPLPDITAKLRQPSHVCNNSHLRPKVAQAKERAESEESLDEAIQRDTVQDKMKLQNLISAIQDMQSTHSLDEDPANCRNQLPRSQLQYIKELGAGWFGKVLQGEGQRILPGHKKTKVVIQMLKEDADAHEQLTFLQEGTAYRDVDHQNVIRMLGQCVETSPFLTVLELCPFGDLKTYLRSHRVAQESFNEKGLLLKFACDMAAGLQALHQQNFVHGDFAIRNCMLASDLSVKVGDYGLAEDIFKEDYYFDGNQDGIPIRWLAPEILVVSDDQVYVRRVNRAANIWSYGVALWEVLTFGALPYGDLTNEHVLRLVVKEQCMRLPKPDVTVFHIERLHQLMQLCWTEPYNRPSLRELRIMLLHLLSQKDELTSAFDQKWNQLMPRRSPKVVNVRDGEKRNGAIPNPASRLDQKMGAQRGSPGIVELNASILGQAGSIGAGSQDSLNRVEVAEVHMSGRVPEPVSPVNDLSLEAELSRANTSGGGQPANRTSLLDELAAADVSGSSLQDGLGSSGGDIGAQDNTGDALAEGPMHESTPVRITLTGADEPADGRKAPIPDLVPTSTLSPGVGSPDFMTSTPKKENTTGEGAESDAYLSTHEGSTQQSSAMYHTAMTSQVSRDSTMSDSSINYEERSLFGQQKFADILQTVTMSFDEDIEPSSISAASSLEKSIEEEVFSPAGKTAAYQAVALDGSTASAMAGADDTVTTDGEERTATPTPDGEGDSEASLDTTPTREDVLGDGVAPLLSDTGSKLVEAPEKQVVPAHVPETTVLSNGVNETSIVAENEATA